MTGATDQGSDMKATEIRKILKLAQEFCVQELTYEGLVIKFKSAKVKQKKVPGVSLSAQNASSGANFPSVTPAMMPVELTSEGIPTEEELLFMSTPFYDQMQELKRIKDEAVESELNQ